MHRLGNLAAHVSSSAASPTAGSLTRRKRLAIGKLQQETNDLSPVPTTKQFFLDFGFHRGPATLVGAGREGSVEGFMTAVEAWDSPPEVVGIASTAAWAAGRITVACWEWLLEEYVGGIERLHAEDGGLDGIYLVLHGAMIVDGLDDPEGELLARVRAVVGPDIPVVASYDIHAHLTPEMCEHADATVFFHTSPHVDIVETGARSAGVLRSLLAGAQPSTVLIKLPLVLPVERANTQPTAAQASDCADFPPLGMAMVKELEREPWCLAAGICYPQPWMNLKDLASGVGAPFCRAFVSSQPPVVSATISRFTLEVHHVMSV